MSKSNVSVAEDTCRTDLQVRPVRHANGLGGFSVNFGIGGLPWSTKPFRPFSRGRTWRSVLHKD